MSTSSTAGMACRFCAFAQGRTEREIDEVLVRTQQYFVVASIGALVPGWILICTNEHRANFAGKYAHAELIDLRLRMARALAKEFRLPVRMFEHGAVGAGTHTGCGVDHAHIHLVAFEADLIVDGSSDLDWRASTASSVDSFGDGREYLFYAKDALSEDPVGRIAFPPQPTSQFFRRAIAHALDRADEFDYRTHPYVENALTTSNALRAT